MTATSPVASESIRQDEKSIAALASWLFLLACAFYVIPTLFPIGNNFLDDHWAAYFNLAFLAHKQFGAGVVFTYGPWGFLVHPRNFAGIFQWAVFGRAILAIGCCAGLAALGHRWIKQPVIRVLWASSILIFAEPIYLLTPLVCLLLWREPPVRTLKDRLLLHTVVFSAGLAANTKFTCFVLLALLIPPLLLRRQTRSLSVTAVLSFLFFWLLAGQALSGLPAFISNSFEVASTYSPAQAWVSVPLGRLAGLILCGLPVLLCAIAELRRPSLESFALLAWFVMFEYTVLGQAIIRCDSGHIALGLIAVAFPLAVALLACPHLWRRGPMNRSIFVAATLFGMLVAYGCLGRTLWSLQPTYRPPIVEAVLRIQHGMRLNSGPPISPANLLTSDPDIGVAVLPYRLNYAFENRLPLISIPMLQSVMAWTPRLTAIDANFLESTRAPRSIYFEIFPLDRHYPSLEDSLAWRSLLTHYQPTGAKDGFLILSRRTRSARAVRSLLLSRTVRLGESIEVPAVSNLLWAEIETQRSLRGKLQMLLMSFERLALEIETPLGNRNFLFQDDDAAAGFLLSPNIDSLDTMQSLYTPGGPVNSPQRVTRFSVREASPGTNSFSRMAQVRIYSLSIQ